MYYIAVSLLNIIVTASRVEPRGLERLTGAACGRLNSPATPNVHSDLHETGASPVAQPASLGAGAGYERRRLSNKHTHLSSISTMIKNGLSPQL